MTVNRNNRKIMDESRINSIIYRIGACLIVSSLLMTTTTTAVSASKQITRMDEGGGIRGGFSGRPTRSLNSGSLIMDGTRHICNNEGELLPKTKELKCFDCTCLNGFVECESEQCPSIDECYYLEKKGDACCNRCKECHYNGTSYKSGTEWTDPDDPCLSYKCLAGVVTQVNLQCYTPCSYIMPPKPDSGQCCPTCLGCKYNGQTVLEGREVTSSEDPCLKCQCKNRRLECTKRACPVLHCPLSKQIRKAGECCPRCSVHRETLSVPGKCILGKNLYNNGEKFSTYGCSNCICNNGTLHCRRTTCPVLECPIELQMLPEPGACCKKCPEVSELQSVCVYNQTTYQHDETWNMDSCRSCRCVNGRPNCAEMKCPEVRCRANEVKQVPAGQCCAKCVESAGICTVFGDPHYKTFDGKFFSFQGMCKYQLTSDCVGHTFSIRVTNDGRRTKSSSWTKTVTLKVNNLKVNLGQKMRVKVNGTRVQLPYVLYLNGATTMDAAAVALNDNKTLGSALVSHDVPTPGDNSLSKEPEVEIQMTEEGVSVSTRIGVQLLWDGTNFLQVKAPVTYKNRLCGLCGNYNGKWGDDFRTRQKVDLNESSVWEFANSWRVGGKKTCSEKNNVNYGQKAVKCKYRKKGSMCLPLHGFDSIFESCTERVSPSNYIESCSKDMCECESDLCYCDSFTAYAHECQRLGVSLPDWRKETGCTLQAMRNGALVVPKQRVHDYKKPLTDISDWRGRWFDGWQPRLAPPSKNKPYEQILEEKIPPELINAAKSRRRSRPNENVSELRRSQVHRRRIKKGRERTPLPLKD